MAIPASSSGPSGSDDQAVELLEQLITQGLSKINQDLAKIRQLIVILFQACLMLPSNPTADPDSHRRARDTLAIIIRHARSHPELLLKCPDTGQDQVPLYKHLIPRLVFVGERSQKSGMGAELCDEAGVTAVTLLQLLCKDVPEDGAPFDKGRQRAMLVLRAFRAFIAAAIEKKPATLFGCQDLSPSPTSAMLLIQVGMASQIPFSTDIMVDFGSSLASLASKGQKLERDHSLFAHVLATSFSTPVMAHYLEEAFYHYLDCPDSAVPPESLLRSVRNHPVLAMSMWWRLAREREQLRPDDSGGRACIRFLLTPIEPFTNEAVIRSALGDSIGIWQACFQCSGDVRLDTLMTFMSQKGSVTYETEVKNRADKVKKALAPICEVDTEKDVAAQLQAKMKSLDPQQKDYLCRNLGRVWCLRHDCDRHQNPNVDSRIEPAHELWLLLAKDAVLDAEMITSLIKILDHSLTYHLRAAHLNGLAGAIHPAISDRNRRLRMVTGHALAAIYNALSKMDSSSGRTGCRRLLRRLQETRVKASPPVRTSIIQTFGVIARLVPESVLGDTLEPLFSSLGDPHPPIVSVAFTEHRDKTPYTLASPHTERISILLAANLLDNKRMVGEAIQFMGRSRLDFFQMTLNFTIPALVLKKQGAILAELASVVKQPLGMMLINHSSVTLAKILLNPGEIDSGMTFLIGTLRQVMGQQISASFSESSLITSCNVNLVVLLVIELGDENEIIRANAVNALDQAQKRQSNGKAGNLETFLKPLMLGIIGKLNDSLHDMQGKMPVAFKEKVVRSIGALIETIGGSMAAFAPQIIASLQGTLGIPELRSATLRSWRIFINRLRFNDSGPFIGRTTAALTAHWKTFNESDRACVIAIINEIADNASALKDHLEDVVDMAHIPELAAASTKLMLSRKNRDFRSRVDRLLDRSSSRNTDVSLTAMAELRTVLLDHPTELTGLAEGDSFDPLVAKIIQSLLLVAVRDGDDEELKGLSYECLGIVGALDPDRLIKPADTEKALIKNNFVEIEEAMDFARDLVSDVLVDAFRATNDTKHQNHLAFAIQELLRFCEFTPKILEKDPSKHISARVRARWEKVPKDQHETLAPLMDSRFSLTDTSDKQYLRPIYSNATTYREWLQNWSADLLTTVMAFEDPRTIASRTIFGVMRGVLRNQDVTVAHHILPHLVLHVLLSGDKVAQSEITAEINTVLQDQVNPAGSADRRMLSAQVIFDLMDHLSRWMRKVRSDKIDKSFNYKAVDSVMSSVETELLANAALQSKAYARSLRGFEQRIISLRYGAQKRDNSDLQTYFERLHEIYAHLDEPDGMEGVSNFVISPSLEHQIREHESTGRWTSAQSCWEVRLQQDPEDLFLHERLLQCLRNLGHYGEFPLRIELNVDTLQTHIRGVLGRHPEWSTPLAAFEAEAAWITGDWSTVDKVAKTGLPMARVMCAVRERNLDHVLQDARRDVGRHITSTSYPSSYDTILQLQIVREIEEIYNAKKGSGIVSSLDRRFETTAPAFRTREALLSGRRTAFTIMKTPALEDQVGRAWILSSKMARKAGYEQTAYSAVLQAREIEAPFAFVQQAKLTREHGGALRALIDLENALKPVFATEGNATVDVTGDADARKRFTKDRNLAKAVLLQARWTHETGRFTANDVIARFTKAISLAQDYESPYYHLGHYYDTTAGPVEQRANANWFTCHYYILALSHGVKYIYRTMPRTLTIWLDLGDYIKERDKDKKNPPTQEMLRAMDKITALMDRSRRELPSYQFLTAFPQIASRLGHKSQRVRDVLVKIMALVITKFPLQALWPTVGLMQSNRPERKNQCAEVTNRAVSSSTSDPLTNVLIKDAERLSGALLRLADEVIDDKRVKEVSVSKSYIYVQQVFPSKMMMPLQDALTGSLPSLAENVRSHMPFPSAPVTIKNLDDKIQVMSSLQRPKKLIFLGSDGRMYPFLCKPHDDLRKDARLMDFNSMINKLLKSASESRRRQLYIRTYAVMPLNEECGLLEWVENTHALKTILENGYLRYGKRVYTSELHNVLEKSRRGGSLKQIEAFKDVILPMFSPTVFHDWFLTTWPEPSAWLSSRMAYSRTLAVMSMIGYVLGLGDRHGENILFDGLTGDTVHVDLNCLFDKGKTFEIPERVPFRLTQNMVDAMGVTGVEGVYRKAAEITLDILRSNSESLMSVLEAFVHDPLVEWTKSSRVKTEKEIRAAADKNLKPIQHKLRGVMNEGLVSTVPNQVEILIQQATTPDHLGLMYQGWAPWL